MPGGPGSRRLPELGADSRICARFTVEGVSRRPASPSRTYRPGSRPPQRKHCRSPRTPMSGGLHQRGVMPKYVSVGVDQNGLRLPTTDRSARASISLGARPVFLSSTPRRAAKSNPISRIALTGLRISDGSMSLFLRKFSSCVALKSAVFRHPRCHCRETSAAASRERLRPSSRSSENVSRYEMSFSVASRPPATCRRRDRPLLDQHDRQRRVLADLSDNLARLGERLPFGSRD